MGDNQGRGKVSGYLVSRAGQAPLCARSKCWWTGLVLPAQSSPLRLWEGLAQWPLSVSAWGCLLSKLPADPQHLPTLMPLLMLFQPLGAPLPLPELAL